MSKWVKTHHACPDQDKCGSSDAASTDEAGKVFCFSCNKQFRGGATVADGGSTEAYEPKTLPKVSFSVLQHQLSTGDFHGCPERGITGDTARLYRALHLPDKTLYGYFGPDSPALPIAIKTRYSDKTFPWVGDEKGSLLFGQQLFNAGSSKAVTITEGECLLPETEVLTPLGWVSLQNYAEAALPGVLVMGGDGEFQAPVAVVDKQYTGDLLHFESGSYKLAMTPKHNMIRIGEDGRWFKAHADSTAKKHLPLPRVPSRKVERYGAGFDRYALRARLQVMLSADFTFRKEGDLYANFSKERKIQRCRTLLDAAGVKYAENVHGSGKTAFFVHRGHGIDASKLFDYGRDLPYATEIIEELVHWDGNTVPNRAQVEYSSKYIENAQFVQTCAHLCGYTSTVIKRKNTLGQWYKVSILLNKKTSSTQKGWKTTEYSGRVMCLQVPCGSLLVRYNGSISVTGNCDAMAAYQLQGSKYPVVSVRHGARGALADAKKQYQWLDSFETIVICFDADEHGQAAAKEVAQLFGGKSKIMKHPPGIKDACEYYQKGRTAEFMTAFWKAERYVPDGIISAEALREKLKTPVAAPELVYPWKGLNAMLRGVYDATLTTWTAGSGVGKSSVLREIVMHALTTTGWNTGLAFLEETPERTLRGLAGLYLGKRIHIDGVEYTGAEIDAAFDALALGERVQLWDHWGSSQIDSVISRLRYMAKAMGCKLLILDHISIVVSGNATNNERQNIDELMTRLRSEVVQQTGCGLHIVSHLTRPDGKPLEEGAKVTLSLLRGSGSIAQLSDTVVAVERNTQDEEPSKRDMLTLRVLKDRLTGSSGVATLLQFNRQTGRMIEIEQSL